jgi:cyclic-di-AMP phosphodiesterase PgpH
MKKNKNIFEKFLVSNNLFIFTVFLLVAAVISITLYPKILDQRHYYKVGDIAKSDIKAKKDFFVINKESTTLKKKALRDSVLSIYDHNVNLASISTEKVNDGFSSVNELFKESNETKGKNVNKLLWAKKADFENKIGIPINDEIYKILEKEKFSLQIPIYINTILSEVFENGIVANKDILLQEIDKGIILREVETKSEKVVKNLKRFYGVEQAKTMVRIIGEPILEDVNHTILTIVIDMAQNLIKPNITFNASETESRKIQADANVEPVKELVKFGEMIIREGEKVTESNLTKLEAMDIEEVNNKAVKKGAGNSLLILFLLIIIYVIYLNYLPKEKEEANKNIFFIACVFIIFFLIAKISSSIAFAASEMLNISFSSANIYLGVPLAAGSMIICLFLGMDIALGYTILSAICAAIIVDNQMVFFIYFLLSGFMSVLWTKECKEYRSLIKNGFKIGLLNAAIAIVINLYNTDDFFPNILWDLVFAFSGGITSGIVAVGLAPIVEIIFGYNSYMKLLGLANLDSPILKRLMIEAPGTYHHSIIVSSMAEAAASSVDADPLLAKVYGYYHDIGKVEKPDYFIENQKDGKNPHNKISPSMSGLVLVAHVKNGIKLAEKYKLGKKIIDAVQQHHGTSIIRYFYNKAKQQKGEDAVRIDDFRYPGPKPQTKEAGIIMMADAVEAASKTLENPTPARIQGLVQDIINKIFSDGQLDNCELTLKDFHNIAKSFNTILNGIYHHRIEYPDSGAKADSKKKEKNGDSDNNRTKEHKDKQYEDSKKDKGVLKRLGLS